MLAIHWAVRTFCFGAWHILSSEMAVKEVGAHFTRHLGHLKSIHTDLSDTVWRKKTRLEPINCHVTAAVMYGIPRLVLRCYLLLYSNNTPPPPPFSLTCHYPNQSKIWRLLFTSPPAHSTLLLPASETFTPR